MRCCHKHSVVSCHEHSEPGMRKGGAAQMGRRWLKKKKMGRRRLTRLIRVPSEAFSVHHQEAFGAKLAQKTGHVQATDNSQKWRNGKYEAILSLRLCLWRIRAARRKMIRCVFAASDSWPRGHHMQGENMPRWLKLGSAPLLEGCVQLALLLDVTLLDKQKALGIQDSGFRVCG